MKKLFFVSGTTFFTLFYNINCIAHASAWTLSNPNVTSYKYSTSNDPTAFDTSFSGFLGDKQVKHLVSSSLKANTSFNFSYDTASPPWLVSLTSPTSTGVGLPGYFVYRMRISSQENGQQICSSVTKNCGPFFGTAKITAAPAISNPSVQIFQAYGDSWDPSSPIVTLNTTGAQASYDFTSPYNDIIMLAQWSSLGNTASLTMSFTQVPAPLPLMATATFLGTFGKIRRLSAKLQSKSKTFL
jgi:hypothetical protein